MNSSRSRYFRHKRLDHGKHEIRLVRIEPGPDEHPIKCVLKHQIIHDESYNCLSYTWGPPKPRQKIILNGLSLWIRQNAWDFLHTARRYGFKDWIWIDAICIDQANYEERNHQVAFMSNIYRSAKMVIVWLGLSDRHASSLYDLSSSLTNASDCLCRQETDFDGEWTDRQIAKRYLSLLQDLGSSKYWSRVWILQELILALELAVLTPNGPVPLKVVLYRLVDEFVREFRYLYDLVKHMRLDELGLGRFDHKYSIQDAIRLTQHRECEVPRDRIYSVTSFVEWADHLGVDYQISDEQVLWRTVRLASSRSPETTLQSQHVTNQDPVYSMSQAVQTLDAEIHAESLKMMNRTMNTAVAALCLTPPANKNTVLYTSLRALLDAFDDLRPQGYWVPIYRYRWVEAGSFKKKEKVRYVSWSICLPYASATHLILLRSTVKLEEDTLIRDLGGRDPLQAQVWCAAQSTNSKPRKWQQVPGSRYGWQNVEIEAWLRKTLQYR